MSGRKDEQRRGSTLVWLSSAGFLSAGWRIDLNTLLES
jgi:hypothetical protein